MLNKIVERIVRMVRFDHSVYREIEHDENANGEALLIVVVASILSAIGTWIATGRFGISLIGLIWAVLGWLLWSWLTMFLGTRLFKAEATFWEVARTLGYATAPRALGILSAVPCLNVVAGIVSFVLSLLFAFFAIRESLDLPTDKTIITIVIGWVIVFVISILLAFLRIGF